MDRYFLSLSVGYHEIVIRETGRSDDMIEYGLIVDENPPVPIAFLGNYVPSVAVNPPHVFVWGGDTLYGIDVEDPSVLLGISDNGFLIHRVYPAGDNWMLVGELGPLVRDASLGRVLQDFDIGEVVLESWCDGKRLVVRDFEGRTHEWTILANGLLARASR